MTRGIALIAALVCLAAFVASVVAMGRRFQQFNAASGRQAFVFAGVDTRAFEFAGRPVSVTDEDKPGQSAVLIKFGDRELRLLAPDSIKPGSAQMPGLVRHAEWLRILRFAPYTGRSREEFLKHLDEGKDRLAIVTRRALTAPDPRTGQVWARDRVFDFNELKSDGSIDSQTLRYPKTKGDKAPKAGELREGTWEKDAAGFLLPGTPPDSLSFGRPTAAFKNDAMQNAGWTLPAAVASGLGLVGALVALWGPRRAKRAP